MNQDLVSASALEQAALIAQRKVSCEELTRFHLERIEKLNPRLHAFVSVFPRRALAAARSKDKEMRHAGAGELPPFHGVPIGIKDLNLVRGTIARFGSRGSWPLISPFDDLTVAPLRRAGFVILGKLATSELGAVPVTEPDLHPPTRNPWNPDFTSGGSSGGSGAAVAAGLLPVAQGSDGGGSIRIPSSFNGLVGLKPARGRVRNQFNVPDKQIIYTSGALTRSVADAAALLDVLAGVNEGQLHWAAAPAGTFSKLALQQPGRLRVRVSYDSPIVKADAEVRAAVSSVARLLSEWGHEVIEAPSPDVTIEEFLPLWRFQIATMPFMRWDRVQPVTRWLREGGRGLTTDEVVKLHLALEQRLLEWFGGCDVWLTPTVAVLPPRVGAFPQAAGDPAATFAKMAEIGAFTAIANVTGQPAISVPAGLSKSGMPIGVQLVGPICGEVVLLQLARMLEEARPWQRVVG